MESSNTSEAISKKIKKSSPLYDYWKSSQSDTEEEKRLGKASKTFPAASLFKKEPYKWEMLYQSIIIEIRKGDIDSIKGLKLLIYMLNDEEKDRVIKLYSNKKIFGEKVIMELMQKEDKKSPTRKNLARFIRILFAIFTNPYGINIKREKYHLYERTGSSLHQLRRLLQPSRFTSR